MLSLIHDRIFSPVQLLHFPLRVILYDFISFIIDSAVAGGIHACDHVEGCGLTGSVGADEGYNLPSVDLQVHIVYRNDAAKLHGDIFYFQNIFCIHLEAPPSVPFFFLPNLRKKFAIPSIENSLSPIIPFR